VYPQQSHQPYQHYQPAPYVQPHSPSGEPLYQVTVTRHTGLLIMWWNQRNTITGTYAQCEAAIDDARTYCLIAGWWSLASLLVWNWVSLVQNASARRSLRQLVAQGRAQPGLYPPPARSGWQTPNIPVR
jgi:hypothetical protein